MRSWPLRRRSATSCSSITASAAPPYHHVVPLGFDLAPFAAIDREARLRGRRGLNVPDDAEVITTVGRLTAIEDQSRL